MHENWTEEYQLALNTPPEPGTVLRTFDGGEIKVSMELTEGRPPFVYGIAYVSNIFGSPIGWFLHPKESKQFHGWKVIFLPRARQEYIKGNRPPVMALKVIRKSDSGKSLLCEIAE